MVRMGLTGTPTDITKTPMMVDQPKGAEFDEQEDMAGSLMRI